MSRAGYNEDIDDNWSWICWRGAVASAISGKRGQAFLKEMLAAMDALPEKKLIARDLQNATGEVCAIGAVGKARGADMSGVDSWDYTSVAGLFGVSEALVREIEYMNDEGGYPSPEERFRQMRIWVTQQIRPPKDDPA